MNRYPRSESFAVALGFSLAIVLLTIRAVSDGLLEKGDGVNHYLIARFSWGHPTLFMDLWGKPLFTLLASPFAQLGHAGVAGFNAVVAGLTAWAGVRALRHAGGMAQIAFPVLVLLAPEYLLMVNAGMTEPLFGLLTMLTVMLLLEGHGRSALFVASLTPLARPEYVVFLPVVVIWFVIERKWRVLPWCLVGSALYAMVAWAVHGDPFWFWAEDPYDQETSAYGSGPLDYFVTHLEMVFGRPALSLALIALLLWPVAYLRDTEQRRAHLLALVTSAVPVVGIVVVHSILWWQGWQGSAGLLRVVVTAVPLAVFFALFTLGRLLGMATSSVTRGSLVAGLGLLALSAWSVSDLLTQTQLPVRPDANQRLLDAVTTAVVAHKGEDEKVFSTHPYVAFRSELDPYDGSVYNHLWGLNDDEVESRFQTGDLIVWDSQLGANESHIPLERLLDDGRLAVLGSFSPAEGYRVIGGRLYELFLFEKRQVERSFTLDTLVFDGRVRSSFTMRVDTLPCSETREGWWCLKAGEFPLELRDLPLPHGIFDEWMVSGTADVQDGSELMLVLSQQANGRGVRYEQESIASGPFVLERRVSSSSLATEQTIYFWNKGQAAFNLKGLTIIRKRWTQKNV